MALFSTIYKGGRKTGKILHRVVSSWRTQWTLKGNRVKYGRNFRSNGVPRIDVWPKGKMTVGDGFSMNNGGHHNMIGRQQPCYFVVMDGAELIIGDNVGISATAIICSNRITIGSNVKIGGNTVIYDTDFHSMHFMDRRNRATDVMNTKSAAVNIGDDVFIGAHTTILKGVTIGERSIVGAGSVVVKNIPANEIWAGNPAKYIRSNI